MKVLNDIIMVLLYPVSLILFCFALYYENVFNLVLAIWCMQIVHDDIMTDRVKKIYRAITNKDMDEKS